MRQRLGAKPSAGVDHTFVDPLVGLLKAPRRVPKMGARGSPPHTGFVQSSSMSPFLGIFLALGCALTTNVGFLFKHRGACAAAPVDFRHPLRTGKALFSSRFFALGMLIAAGAWIFHVAALAVAPMSIVQAVLAGGVVLLAIM